jgi:hypothetical protein
LFNLSFYTSPQLYHHFVRIVGLSICITSSERINIIQEARHSFNHEDQSKHNEEIMSNVDKVLAKHLTYLMYQYTNETVGSTCTTFAEGSTQNSSTPTDANEKTCNLRLELAITCDALESTYRATSEVVGLSFRRLGPELLHLLLYLLQQEINQRKQSFASITMSTTRTEQRRDDSSEQTEDEIRDVDDSIYHSPSQEGIVNVEGDLILRKATKILAHFARVGEATKPIAHYSGSLQCLLQLISCGLVPWDARLSALWILANLACNAENMVMMASTTNLVQGLVDVANRPLTPNDTLEMMLEKLRSRSIASRAILNLSWAPENKILLAENTMLLDLVANLCTFDFYS